MGEWQGEAFCCTGRLRLLCGWGEIVDEGREILIIKKRLTVVSR